MSVLSFTRRFVSPFLLYPHILGSLSFSSEVFRHLRRDSELYASSSCDDSRKLNNYSNGIELPQLISSKKFQMENFSVDLVDSNLWLTSFNFADSLNGMARSQETALNIDEDTCDDKVVDGLSMAGNSFDFDEIEDLRIQKKLVYQLDRGSKEHEECKIDFHRRKTSKKRLEKQRNVKVMKGCKKPEEISAKPSPKDTKHLLSKEIVCHMQNEIDSMRDKKVRTPTFNQLTEPYHLPFCLDIFITKGSVRAAVIHRVTSKVVVVAHSISKDMKFDLTSKKDATTCAAVGEILAQRAIEDDIHNIVYTPRKGEKIEGKLQIVLQSIIDHGINVKVKLKQKKLVKTPVMNHGLHP